MGSKTSRRRELPRHRKSQGTHAKSRCTGLVVADGTIRRKKERALYRRRTTELERETARLKVYEEQDGPAFSAWIEREFERELRELRDTAAAIDELDEVEGQVRSYAALRRVPLWKAYQEVEAARAAGTVASLFGAIDGGDPGDADDGDDDAEAGGPWDDHDTEAAEADMRAAFSALGRRLGLDVDAAVRDLFGDDRDREFGPGEWDSRGRGWGWQEGAARTTAGERSADAYLKSLYRQLVRALHPDAGSEMNDDRRRVWAEVQDAYAWGDVDRLARLHAEVCGGMAGGRGVVDLGTIPIGDIIALRMAVERRVRHVREELREARLEPAWGFTVLLGVGGGALARLRRQIDGAMRSDLRDLGAEKAALDRIVAVWRKGPRHRAKAAPGLRTRAGRGRRRGSP